jgi:hypothetical protein
VNRLYSLIASFDADTPQSLLDTLALAFFQFASP